MGSLQEDLDYMKKDMDPKKKLYLVMALSVLALVVMLLVGKFQQQKALKKKYPIRKMYLVEKYWAGDSTSTDGASIKADNTSCFNYRAIIGSTKVSKHAMGLAIDLNPFENPYIPKHNGSWDYRALGKKEKGFAWGGSWRSVKDYQHFEK